jgi:ribosomal protein S18 acetylase RimI-like enzyme
MGIEARNVVAVPTREVEETMLCSSDLPYASDEHNAALGGDVHHFVVRDGATITGHVVLDVAGAVGGIYDMGVLPNARRRGFGRALTLTALERARRAGCTSVTLNATGEGEPLYRSAGFESVGHGMTWWLFPRPEGVTHLWRR